MAREFTIDVNGVSLSGEEAGEGVPVLLLHGLTATRRYVVMGSTLLARTGHRVIQYDARAHGRSSPAPAPDAYSYDQLGADALAVLDQLGVGAATWAGASMGAHTLLNVALRAPERVAGIVVITPAYAGGAATGEHLARWDALADGLRSGGVEGFVAAYGPPRVSSPELARTVSTVMRQRLAQHQHLDALADCLHWLPRTRPFHSLTELAAIDVPAAVVASSDETDPDHPEALGRAYAQALPRAELISDRPGKSPIAWQGSQLSRIIANVAAMSELQA